MSKWYDAIERRWDGGEHYIKEEVVDGVVQQTWATEINGHNVCVVRYDYDNSNVSVWVDTAGKNTSLDNIDSFILGRLLD